MSQKKKGDGKRRNGHKKSRSNAEYAYLGDVIEDAEDRMPSVFGDSGFTRMLKRKGLGRRLIESGDSD